MGSSGGYYPIFLEMTERPCLVVGGGPVAERKVQALLHVGARVRVVSLTLTERLGAWEREGRIDHVARRYHPGDLAGYQLAFVATENGEVNAAVAREGRERGVWVNAADDPAHCDFILPALLRRGELLVAVATGGSSPALSRAVREDLEAYLTEDYTALSELTAEVRSELRAHARSPDGEQWRRALDADLRRLIAEGKRAEAKARLLEKLGAEQWG